MNKWAKSLSGLGLLCGVALAEGDVTLNEARAYLDKGEPKAAVIQLKNVLQTSPEHGEARLLLGETYLKLGDGASAVKELEKASELKLPKEKWVVPLSRAYLLQDQPKKVLETAKVGVEAPKPLRSQLGALQGLAYIALNDAAKAKSSFEEALQLDADSGDALLGLAMLELSEKRYGKVEEYANRAVAKDAKNGSAWTVLGESRRLQGNGQGAIEAFGKAIEIQPADVRARLGRATAYLASGKLEDASKDVNEVRAKAGELPMALYLQAVIAFQNKKVQDAEDTLVKVLNALPNHPPSLLLMGSIAYQQEKLQSAENYLSKYLGFAPDQLPALKLLGATRLRLGHAKDAIAVLQPAADRHSDDAQLLALLGSAYLNDKQYDQGTDYLARAAELAPDNGFVRERLALGRIATGNMDQAVADLKSAVEIDPNLVQADITLVLALLQQKKYDEAIAAAVKLKEKKSNDPMPDNLLGTAYMAKGEGGKAREHWLQALSIKQDYNTARLNLARLALTEKKPDEARRELVAVLKTDPNNLNALLGLAQLAESQGDQAEMLKYLQEARDKNPRSLPPALLLSRYYLGQNKALNALEIAQAAERDNPDNPQAIFNLAQVQLVAGQDANAVATLRKLVAKQPENPDFRHTLAQALAKTGDKAQAANVWGELRQKSPDYIPALAALAELALQDKDYARAGKLANELKTKAPKVPVGLQLEGDVRFAQKQYSQALESYQQAYKQVKNPALAQRLFKARLAQGDFKGAVDGLHAWLEAADQDVESWLLLALAHQEKNHLREAAEAYEKVETLRPGNSVVLNNLAWVYQEQGDKRALEIAEKIQLGSDSNPELVDTIGWIYLLNGKPDKGLLLLQQAAVQAPHLIPIRLHLAEALIKNGKPEEGKKELQRLLKEKKDFPEKAKAESLLKGLP
ncbi:XrtA/PEP-CTERM system TPR-repeat protein PrsT [Methylococcus sp. EFPC2]|uniref:XrtA/PEP-CTERM system TPR-repeat protein PrsT n=1 Tax=Methylococcus sp. EFPC2 TaxID=2812648 RepID=UPI0019673C41|nr:XrtA/PEP-CTERM system TPR-repeat protein PrsT [Methylococcus sp. EFPC2]QSA98803.1 PEP-CTERM system TPR-repeat protein PrsT [Methylococcus sp. EFPC2]